MPDSAPQSRDPNPQRFAIGVTRVCLASGTLQVPFAMRGVFEPGTYQARDVELDESHELVFEPPRSLIGLDAVFTAHDLHPNDEVILTVTKEGLTLDVSKRPRRKAPQAKGEPWESVRNADSPARPAQTAGTAQPQSAMSDAAAASAEQDAPEVPAEDDADAPRMVRARRVDRSQTRRTEPVPEMPADHAQSRVRERHVSGQESEPETQRQSAAQRFYDDTDHPDDRSDDDRYDTYDVDGAADQGWDWERPSSQTGAPTDAEDRAARAKPAGGFFAKIARTVEAAKGALSFRGPEPEEERDDEAAAARPRYVPSRWDDTEEVGERARGDATATPDDVPRVERGPAGSHGPAASSQMPSPPRSSAPSSKPSSMPSSAPASSSHSAHASSPAAKPEASRGHVVVEDADAETMDRLSPVMWELGEGDLRSRLVRFLRHPDVPVILRTEMVARNFGLGSEVADAMLEDLTNDKIDGLVVTKVRDETYRISRAPSKL